MSTIHIKFTQPVIERLAPPPSGRDTYWDLLLPGFGMRVSAPRHSGHVHKVFVAMYRVGGKLVMETIGSLTLITRVEDARERARASMRKAQDGINSVEEKRRAKWPGTNPALHPPVKDKSLLLPECAARYMQAYWQGRKKNGLARRERTIDQMEAHLMRVCNWQPRKYEGKNEVDDGENWSLKYADDLSSEDMERYCQAKGDAGFPAGANAELAAMKGLFKWLTKKKTITANPIADMESLFPDSPRERWLTDPEIQAFWWACGKIGRPYGSVFKVLLTTATRLREVAELPLRGELSKDDDQIWTLPPNRNKSGRVFLVYMTDLTMGIINSQPCLVDSEYVFSSARGGAPGQFDRAKKPLDKMMTEYLQRNGHLAPDEKLKPWVIHDLRHTARTNFSKLGVRPDIGELLLNHAVGGVRKVYDHWQYLDEKREALEKWSDRIKTIIS